MALPRDIDARKFARVALQRLDEAVLIHEKLALSAAAQYLGGYAIECILKALVIATTPANKRPQPGRMTIAWMSKEFGHDLERLRTHLASHSHRLPHQLARGFVLVSSWDPRLRYEPGPGDADESSRFLAAAESIVKWASERM